MWLAFVSCASGTDAGADIVSVRISLPPDVILVGESRQLVARDQAERELAAAVLTWSTSAPGIATVSSTGLLTGVAAGAATITVTAQGKQGMADVAVLALTLGTIVAGGAHSCALTVSGSAYCWGRGEVGQLGVFTRNDVCTIDGLLYPCIFIPAAVEGDHSFTQLAAGASHTCALKSDGAAFCWGRNNAGQLGDNSTNGLPGDRQLSPVAVAGGLGFTRVSVGALHTCGLTANGTAYCWGANSGGQLGDGTTTNRPVPVAVSGGLTFTQITTGGYTRGLTCGLTSGGAAYCWGENVSGQLGLGTADTDPHTAPVPVSGGLTFASLAAGASHICGITTAGAAYCWGANVLGSLGDGTQTQRNAPAAVTGGLTFTEIATGGFSNVNAHTCARTNGGQAYCWGDNGAGALGTGTLVNSAAPVAVTGGLTFTSVTAGLRHTCGRSSAGVVYCWGSNGAGQLGIGFAAAMSVPTKIIGQP
jgi:alpha-tubulin suppressor-like RCC1 family protein